MQYFSFSVSKVIVHSQSIRPPLLRCSTPSFVHAFYCSNGALTQSVSYSPPHTTATAWAHSKLHMIYNEYVWQSVMSAIATATNGINYYVVCSAIFHLPPNKCTHFRFVHRNLFRKIFSCLFNLVVQVHRNRFRSMPTWVQSEQCVRSRLKRTHIQFHFNLCVGELFCSECKLPRKTKTWVRFQMCIGEPGTHERNILNRVRTPIEIFEKKCWMSWRWHTFVAARLGIASPTSHQPSEVSFWTSLFHPAFHCFAAPTTRPTSLIFTFHFIKKIIFILSSISGKLLVACAF